LGAWHRCSPPVGRRHEHAQLSRVSVSLDRHPARHFQFHLRAVRYGSPELSAFSPAATLASFRLRTGSRFLYEYDLNIPWRHEIRVERLVERAAGRHYPFCLDGHGAARPRTAAGRPVTSPGSARP
jgi:Plasmid pRiA4b ORF-3-like protein